MQHHELARCHCQNCCIRGEGGVSCNHAAVQHEVSMLISLEGKGCDSLGD